MKKLSIFLFTVFLFTCCTDESNFDALARNKQEIEEYLANNNLEAQQTDSDLYYIINEEGDSERPTSTTTVTVNYVGTLLNGVEFDSGENISFGLNQVIRGWTEGLQLIGRGGDIDLLIPAKLAYAKNPPAGSVIGENEALFFNVQLLDF